MAERPSTPLQLLTTLAVVLAIATPALQAGLDLGLSQREFADDGNETLRVAGFAFSIWTLIYAGLIAFAIRVWRSTSSAVVRLAGPAALAITGCAAWIVASASDGKWASVAIILASAAAAAVGLIAASGERTRSADRWMAVYPISLLSGWLIIASAVNVLTVLTAFGVIDSDSPVAPAAAGVAVAVLAGSAVSWAARQPLVLVPIAWGLFGAWAAERADQPQLAWICLAALAVTLGLAVVIALRRPRTV